MTQPPAPFDPDTPPVTQRLPPNPRRSFASSVLGFIGWVFTLVLSVALALGALAAIAFYGFGITLATPGQIRQASADVFALQTQVATVEAEAARLRSAEIASADTLEDALLRVGELEAKVEAYERQAADLVVQADAAQALALELEENIDLAATIQAESRDGQVLVSVVATVQAENSDRLAELQARTERLSRFLQRLGDLAGDAAALDETPASATPVATTGTAEPSATVATPTVQGTPTVTPRP
jgi:hypothetical protein